MPTKRKTLRESAYQLTDGDWAIFSRVKKNPNYFTDFYMKGDNTGTWWRPTEVESDVPEINEVINRWKRGYAALHAEWIALNQPKHFIYKSRYYDTHIEDDFENPAFHDNHGFIFIPYQLDIRQAKQPTRVNIGGYGAAKSVGSGVSMLIDAATLPGYEGYVLAPYTIQTEAVHQAMMTVIQGTEYERRFLINSTLRPYPKIVIGNSHVLQSTIKFFAIKDDPGKILNLSGDMAHIDQAEQVDDLDQLIEFISSRLRGHVYGRERQGIINIIANSEDSPALWDLFDEAEERPKDIYSVIATTFQNPYLTPRQMKLIEERMGKDPQRKDVALRGARPIGSGQHFSAVSITKCRNLGADEAMEQALKDKTPGWSRIWVPKAQVVTWRRPPLAGHTYLLAADPGFSNPPERNSAALGVFDVSLFPEFPAEMVAFEWVSGNNSPDPWLQMYTELCIFYNCIGRNAFDATGPQAGYDRYVHGLQSLLPTPVNFQGAKKYVALNNAKVLTARGMWRFPNIPLLYSQMAKYRLPDEKLKQDIVAMLFVAAAKMEEMFYSFFAPKSETDKIIRPKERYHTHKRDKWRTR